MRSKTIEIACPDCLRQRLRVFRVEKPAPRAYFVTDPLQNQTYEFAAWQFFVLEVLTECESFSQLVLWVEERYGEAITQEDLDGLLALIAEKRLFALPAQKTPLLADFNRRRPPVLHRTSQALPREVGDTQLPAAVRHALAFDADTSRKGWRLFDPTPAVQAVHPFLVRFRRAVYLIPLVLVPALVIVLRHHAEFSDDLLFRFGEASLAMHAVIGLLTVNLAVTFITALVAYHYGIIASAFCIIFYFGFWPRFMVRVGSVEHLPRRARLWYYASPLLVRLTILSLMVLLWFGTRHAGGFPARFSLAVALIAEIDFLVTSMPLIDSNGYRLLATAMDAPKLRQKATIALASKFQKAPGESADKNHMLVVYSVASSLFVVAVVVGFLLLLGRFLNETLGGTVAVLALLAIGTMVCFRVASAIRKLGLTQARAQRFRNWQRRETHGVD